MSIVRIACSAALAAGVLLSPATASAQAYIGNTIGNMVAQGEANIEQACMAGVPAAPANAGFVEARVTELMTNYFALAPKGDAKGVSKLFLRTSTTRWRGPDGAAGDWKKIADPFLSGLAPDAISIERTAFVVANNARGARGVWVATIPDANQPSGVRKVEYAVDFVWDTWWGRTYIQHMALHPEPGTARPPVAYCHLDAADYY